MTYYKRKNVLSSMFSRRNRGLRTAGFKNYADWLKSDYWADLKSWWAEKRRTSRFWNLCWVCSGVADVLHHIRYKSKPEKLAKKSLVVPVCNSCHRGIHNYSNSDTTMSLKRATRQYRALYLKSRVERENDL